MPSWEVVWIFVVVMLSGIKIHGVVMLTWKVFWILVIVVMLS